ncbi:MAG: enoyl-CoA hydratase/isomerase family protein [Nocardioidaceae bacterium]
MTDTPTEPPVLLTIADGVAHIELNRPQAFNAFSTELGDALYEAVRTSYDDPDVKVILLSGRGRAFCGGGDVKLMAAAEDPGAEVRAMADSVHRGVQALAECGKTVIAAVHGSAAGGGLGLLCSADLVLAGASAKFVAAYAGIAVTPDCSLSWGLPRIVGERRALEMVLLNRPIDAATALDWGLVNQVHADDGVLAEGLALAQRLAASPAATALAASRRLIRDAAHRNLAEHLVVEAASIAHHVNLPESRELVQAFARK